MEGNDVVICNDDIAILTPQWLDIFQEHLDTKRGMVAAVGPVSNNILKKQLMDYVGTEIQELPYLSFCCIAISREALQVGGGLDERFGNGPFDDLDWSERAKAKGFKLLVDRRAWVWHYGSQSMQTSSGLQNRDQARALLLEKHPHVEDHLPKSISR